MYGFFSALFATGGSDHRQPMVESLEGRTHLSAATVWANLRPLPRQPHGHAVHAKPKVGSLAKVYYKQTGPNLLGTWTGTFTNNSTQKPVPGSITFTSRHNDTFTGTFDTSSIGGAATVTAVTVTKNRQFLIMQKFAPKQQVSMTGVVQSDFKSIIGRYSVQTLKKWTTGVFRFDAPATAP